MSRFLSPRLDSLTPYTPGEQPRDQQYIKLNTNESPFPPAPGVIEAVSRERVASLNLYSDPTAKVLEDAIAGSYGLSPDQVIAGNGSDEILAFCFQAFCDRNTPPVYPDITYGFYKALAQLYCLTATITPLADDFTLSPETFRGVPGTVFLANPNAPTGIALPLAAVAQIAEDNPDRLVIVDEAYVDFGAESAVSLLSTRENVLVVMTFSKSRSLAGARIGYALGSAELIADLRRIKFAFHPYNVNALSQAVGAAAMRDEGYFRDCVEEIMSTRAFAADVLKARGYTLTDSLANFLFVKHPALSGLDLYRKLREKGVLTRHFPGPRTGDYLRVTMGSRAQMERCLAALTEIEGEQP